MGIRWSSYGVGCQNVQMHINFIYYPEIKPSGTIRAIAFIASSSSIVNNQKYNVQLKKGGTLGNSSFTR